MAEAAEDPRTPSCPSRRRPPSPPHSSPPPLPLLARVRSALSIFSPFVENFVISNLDSFFLGHSQMFVDSFALPRYSYDPDFLILNVIVISNLDSSFSPFENDYILVILAEFGDYLNGRSWIPKSFFGTKSLPFIA